MRRDKTTRRLPRHTRARIGIGREARLTVLEEVQAERNAA